MSVKLKTKPVSLRIDVSDVEIDASNDETIRKSAECFRQAIVKKSGIPFYFLDVVSGDLEEQLLETSVDKYDKIDHTNIKLEISPEYSSRKERPIKALVEDISKLMKDDVDTADFTLKTKTKSFRIHKLIFGARSIVFKAMFQANMAEAQAGEVIIEDLDEDTVEEMIHFIYTGSLSGKQSDFQSLCQAARKYQLDSMMDLIDLKLMAAELDPGEVADIFIASKMFDRETMFKTALNNLRKGSLEDVSFTEKMKAHPELIEKIKKKWGLYKYYYKE